MTPLLGISLRSEWSRSHTAKILKKMCLNICDAAIVCDSVPVPTPFERQWSIVWSWTHLVVVFVFACNIWCWPAFQRGPGFEGVRCFFASHSKHWWFIWHHLSLSYLQQGILRSLWQKKLTIRFFSVKSKAVGDGSLCLAGYCRREQHRLNILSWSIAFTIIF